MVIERNAGRSGSARRWFAAAAAVGFLAAFAAPGRAQGPADPPNIVYILADDLGYGDVHAFNARSKIATPNLDRLAGDGMRFTDAHSGSAVCTPTRYGILTGRYAWRTRLQQSVFGGYSPPLIDPGRITVASLLKRHGYRTACIGKWHLGLEWATRPHTEFGDTVNPAGDIGTVDYRAPFRGGPTALGFDEFFGISGALDMPPFIFLNGDRCEGVPTVRKTWLRTGPAEKDFEAEEVMSTITTRAVAFLEAQAKARRRQPFFLYFPLTAPHTPIVPSREFQGKSRIGTYGDFVMEIDASVGAVMRALDRLALAQNTLMIFTSDNGCSPAAELERLALIGHDPNGEWRGCKADVFEGGHRIPFIARWPGKVKPGSTCADTICLTDLLATCAAIVGERLPANAGEDSVNILPDLLGTARGPLREATVHHSIYGAFAIRQGPWKLALCPDSGGWSYPFPGRPDSNRLPRVQLYNLEKDPSESENLQAKDPDVVARLTALLQRYVREGRSTPGNAQRNDVPVSIRPFYVR
jgi:arylsulfatase A-like enzyme